MVAYEASLDVILCSLESAVDFYRPFSRQNDDCGIDRAKKREGTENDAEKSLISCHFGFAF